MKQLNVLLHFAFVDHVLVCYLWLFRSLNLPIQVVFPNKDIYDISFLKNNMYFLSLHFTIKSYLFFLLSFFKTLCVFSDIFSLSKSSQKYWLRKWERKKKRKKKLVWTILIWPFFGPPKDYWKFTGQLKCGKKERGSTLI